MKAQNGGKLCIGDGTKTEHCNTQGCPVHCQWSEWHYGSCSKTCGTGVVVISRTEKVKALNGGKPCFGDRTRTKYCNIQECAVDCQWSAWYKEGECTGSCNGGIQGQFNNYGSQIGQQIGRKKRSAQFNNWGSQIGQQISGGYGGGWGGSGGGTQVFTRTQIVKAQNGGKPCFGDGTKTEHCNFHGCPIDCQWSEWHYGPCSKTCGSGGKVISRTEKVKAQNGGKPCFGDGTKTEYCNIQDCVVDCRWSAWYKEGECSRSCDGGKQIFLRREEVKSLNGGKPCFGSDSKIESCNNHGCHEPGK